MPACLPSVACQNGRADNAIFKDCRKAIADGTLAPAEDSAGRESDQNAQTVVTAVSPGPTPEPATLQRQPTTRSYNCASLLSAADFEWPYPRHLERIDEGQFLSA
jgi:hypothetical protein